MPYIGTSPSNGVRRIYSYTATASQTIFSGASTEGQTLAYTDSTYIDVYQNGVLLDKSDYTSTNGTQVVLAQGASVNDVVVIIVYDVFSVADTVSKSDGGTFDGNVTMGGTLGVTGATTFSSTVSGTGYDLLASALDSSTATSLEISLPTGYTSYYLTITLVGSTSTSGHFDFVYKLDGQSSFHTSDYTTQGQLLDNGTSLNENASASNIQLMANDSALDGHYAFNIWLNGYGTTDVGSVLSYIVSKATDGGSATWVGGGANTVANTNNSKMVEIKITPSTGNISKSHYRLYGIA